jgi:uncharacterized integral membrane protein
MRRLTGYLVIALLVGVLALQNRQALRLHFFFWTIPAVSVSLLVLGSTLLGALLGISFRLYDQVYPRLRRRPESTPASAEVVGETKAHE